MSLVYIVVLLKLAALVIHQVPTREDRKVVYYTLVVIACMSFTLSSVTLSILFSSELKKSEQLSQRTQTVAAFLGLLVAILPVAAILLFAHSVTLLPGSLPWVKLDGVVVAVVFTACILYFVWGVRDVQERQKNVDIQ